MLRRNLIRYASLVGKHFKSTQYSNEKQEMLLISSSLLLRFWYNETFLVKATVNVPYHEHHYREFMNILYAKIRSKHRFVERIKH